MRPATTTVATRARLRLTASRWVAVGAFRAFQSNRPRTELAENADRRDSHENAEPHDTDEAIDPIDANDPTDPMASTDPTDPIESTESTDPIERSELRERRDSFEVIPQGTSGLLSERPERDFPGLGNPQVPPFSGCWPSVVE